MRDRTRHLVLVAAAEDQGIRLDLFLRKRSGSLSRARARDLLAAGGVSLNGRRVKIASRPLRTGDRVEVFSRDQTRPSPPPTGREPFRVIHEDRAALIVDKAPGVLVQPTPQGDRGVLLDLLRRYLKKRYPHIPNPYLGLLHRIDRDTSGLLLFSRMGAANRVLAEQFRTHTIEREYLALVRGDVKEEMGTIVSRLARNAPQGLRVAIRMDARGRRAVTHYRVMERFGPATLLSVKLETGRTHQIRIHLSDLGHPVVGDKSYGRPLRFPHLALLDTFPRQALHAGRLGFTHPLTGRWMSFEAPLPPDFAELLATLRSRSGGAAPVTATVR
ncbi:MAG TPA: RluA family pseudouridine synthase [Candidatus Polarisedimenticolia bacterium]|nr:RluA family pseudouridine synthase [Candidatus Polarisedimenticolia bacterium]